MTKYFYLKFIILFIFIAGCEENKYCIEMKPYDGGVERKLTCPSNIHMDKDERERIAKLYEKQVDPNTFWGKFNESLPNDVGGAGFYTTLSIDMGEVTIYSERFRGNDNLNDTLLQSQLFVDCHLDFLLGWLEYELGDDPNFVNFRDFCNNNLRHDVKNIAVYLWLCNISSEYNSNASEGILMRAKHYWIERGYLGPKQMRLWAESSEAGEARFFCFLRKVVANKMDYSSQKMASARLMFLSDGKHAEESMARYVRSTDIFKQEWEAEKLEESDPNAEPPEIDIEDFITRDIDFEFDFLSWPSGTEIEVKLACKNKPFETNGGWDEKTSQVVWSRDIAGDGRLPTFFYASWSEPNVKYQEERFGTVVLSDKALADYCMWRKNLDEAKGKEWDSFILSLSPGQNLEKQIGSFRFLEDKQKQKELDAGESDLAEMPRNLILAGLKANSKGEGGEKRSMKTNETGISR